MEDKLDNLKIGIWVPEKKWMQLAKFEQLCRKRGSQVVLLDLSLPLEGQGPFDVILQKLTDGVTFAADNGDPKSLSGLDNFKSYVLCHPEVAIVNHLERTHQIMQRRVMFQMLRKACQAMQFPSGNIKVFVPDFVELQAGQTEREWFDLMCKSNVQFPVVCKPSDAGIPEVAHDMSLVFNAQGLKQVSPPCVAQSFVNHDGVLYKLFIFGDRHFLSTRPSLKNITAGADMETEHFTTSEVSKPDSKSHLTHKTTSKERESSVTRLDDDVTKCIAREVRHVLDMDLMGIDVIVSSRTGHYAIIDVNPFPGCYGLPEYHEKLYDFLKRKVSQCKPDFIE